MPNLSERMAEMEAMPGFKALSPQKQAENRRLLGEKVRAEYKAAATAGIDEAKANHPFMGRLGAATGAALYGAADTMTLGYAPQIGSALSGGLVDPQEIRARSEAFREASPVAGAAGNIAGFFTPGAGSAIAGGAAKGATRLLGMAVPSIPKAAVTAGFAGRASANLLQNLVGGTAANTAVRLTENADEERGLLARLQKAGNDALNPVGIALTGAVSLGQAKLTRNPAIELQRIIQKYERISGRRVQIDTLSNDAGQQAFMDRIARTPGMRSEVQRLDRMAAQGVLDVVDDIARRQGARGSASAAADARTEAGLVGAAGVRRLGGVRSTKDAGAITKGRLATQAAAYNPVLKDSISDAGKQSLRDGLAAILKGRSKAGNLGSFGEVISKVSKLTKRNMRVDDLEEIRQQNASASAFSTDRFNTGTTLSKQGQTAARDFYHVISGVIAAEKPQIQQALEKGEAMRRMAEVLPVQKFIDLDDRVAASFWSGSGVMERIRGMSQHGTPAEYQALKGWLWWDMVNRSVNPKTGRVSSERMRKLFDGGGMHNRQVWDTTMPGARQELLELTTLTDVMFRKGLLSPEGAQTAGRIAGRWTGPGASAAAMALAGSMYLNPQAATVAILGTAGLGFVIQRSLKSLVSGHAQNAMQKLSRQGPTPLGRGAAAASTVPNPLQYLPTQ